MEFSEAAKTNAHKFLQEITSRPPPGIDQDAPLPVGPSCPKIAPCEMESECLHMAKCYLGGHRCPGYLSYYISAEAYRQLSQEPIDKYLAEPEESEDGPAERYLNNKLLATDLLARVHKVCESWRDNLPYLTAPVEKTELSIHAIKNTRRKMEDRHTVCLDVNSLYGLKDYPSQSFYAVFDGHVGVEAASYASIHLLTNIVRHQSFLDDPVTAIKEGVKLTDEQFCKKEFRSGATAVVSLIREKKLYVGWVGDSQACLVRKGESQQLVVPHKPDREDEQRRIEDAGGLVIWMGAWRVNGNLSVSRAIGDPKDKKYVIGEADVAVFDLEWSDEYLVIACDGIWDVLTDKELSECVSKHLESENGSKNSIAKAIIDCARAEGSCDNMSVIVVFLEDLNTPTATSLSSESPPSQQGAGGANTGSDTAK